MTTLWLTRVIPDVRNHEARRDFKNTVQLHYRVMDLFPDNLGDEARRQLGVLFRLEETPAGPYLLLQSRIPPDLTKLPPGYGSGQSSALSPLLDVLRPGLPVRYRIDANAVRKPGKTTRALYDVKPVVPLSGAAAEEWWHRQAEISGLKLESVHARRLESASGVRPKGGHRVHHARTRFEGIAHVLDQHLLRSRIEGGIGRGKAYGCGLLSLAPAPPNLSSDRATANR